MLNLILRKQSSKFLFIVLADNVFPNTIRYEHDHETGAFPVFAHAGHDHSSIFANIIHLLWLAPIFVTLAIIYTKFLTKNYQMKPQKKQLKEE